MWPLLKYNCFKIKFFSGVTFIKIPLTVTPWLFKRAARGLCFSHDWNSQKIWWEREALNDFESWSHYGNKTFLITSHFRRGTSAGEGWLKEADIYFVTFDWADLMSAWRVYKNPWNHAPEHTGISVSSSINIGDRCLFQERIMFPLGMNSLILSNQTEKHLHSFDPKRKENKNLWA